MSWMDIARWSLANHQIATSVYTKVSVRTLRLFVPTAECLASLDFLGYSTVYMWRTNSVHFPLAVFVSFCLFLSLFHSSSSDEIPNVYCIACFGCLLCWGFSNLNVNNRETKNIVLNYKTGLKWGKCMYCKRTSKTVGMMWKKKEK